MSGKKLVLSVDLMQLRTYDAHQASINLLDESGAGEGYRLYGPSYAGNSANLFEAELFRHERDKIRGLIEKLDGPLTASDEAIEAAAKAFADHAIGEETDIYETWDEMGEEDREVLLGSMRAALDVLLPHLKYEVQ